MNIQKISLFGTMLCLLGLGFSDTAAGQTLTASPVSPMTFTVQGNGATATQNLSIKSSVGATTLIFNISNAPSWLTVNNVSPGSFFPPLNTASNGTAVVPITVNTQGLNVNTTSPYIGTFTVEINNFPDSLITYEVELTVGNPSALSADPGILNFTAVQGAQTGTPSSIPVTMTSSNGILNYTVSATTQNNSGNWILLTNTTGSTNSNPGFTVQVNPSLLTPGNTYSGTITVQSTSTTDSVVIPVSLTVSTGSALTITGSLNNFIYQVNAQESSFTPETQNLMISATGSNLNYQIVVTPVSGPTLTSNWLLAPTGGLATSTPQNIPLSLSSFQTLSSLAAGTYVANIAISPTGNSGAVTNVTATLIVTNNAIITVNNTGPLSFTLPFGSGNTLSKNITVTSSGASVAYTVSTTQPWLTVQPQSGTTPSAFTIYVTDTGLNQSATPYTGLVTIFPNNNDQGLYSVQIPVSLTVTSATSQLYAAPSSLLYSYQTTTTAPGLQLVELTSTASTGFSVTTSTTPANNCPSTNWLSYAASSFATPATLSVSAATAGMTAGSCMGVITVTYNNGVSQSTTLTIPVTVDISATPLLTITPDANFGVFTGSYGSTTALTSRISVNSTDGSALGFSASASTPGSAVSWLFLGASSGTTQQYLQVQISPSGLQVGTYNGTITITPNNGANLPSGPFQLPVTLIVSANTTVTVTPTSLAFTQAQGANPPASQVLSVTATGGSTSYTATVSPVTGGNWLTISQSSVTASSAASTITATVGQNTLSPGQYKSSIILTYQNAATPTTTIPVTLNVTSSQLLTVSPTSLTFSYQLGGATPATQTLNVSSASASVAFSTSVSAGWLTVNPPTGTTGAAGTQSALVVALVPSALTTAQTYNGTITITANGQTPIVIPVTVTVTGIPVPQPGTISNSASGAFGAIAPGELITIKGTNLGPANPATFSVIAGTPETVSSTLDGVQVTFDGIPGTPTYVSSTQINVIVPYEIAGRSSTNVVVSYQSEQSSPIPQNVANYAPGIYTFSATGAGQAAALNQNYSLNGPSIGIVVNGTSLNTTPAAPGTDIIVYITGAGVTSPAGTTGTVTPSSPLQYVANATATIGGVNAVVAFAGAAPGEVTGVVQLNITVPANVTGNALPLMITINGVTTPAGATVAVQ